MTLRTDLTLSSWDYYEIFFSYNICAVCPSPALVLVSNQPMFLNIDKVKVATYKGKVGYLLIINLKF